MVEQALYFALGVCVAGLLALAAAPAFWRRALRLTRRRLELLTPLDAAEAAAERDHVRAEAAMLLRRGEQALSAERERRAADLAEAGRRALRIAELEDGVSARDASIAGLTEAAALARRDAREAQALRGGLEQAVWAAEGLRDAADRRAETTQRSLDDKTVESERRRLEGVALDMRLSAETAARVALEEERERLTAALEARGRESAALASERDFLKSELARSEAGREQLSARYVAQGERLAAVEREATALREELRRAEQAGARAREATQQEQAARAAAEHERDELRARLAAALTEAQSQARDAEDRLEVVRAEIASLSGALEAARRAREDDRAARALEAVHAMRDAASPADPDARTPPLHAGDAELRRLIRDIGARALSELPQAAPASAPAQPAREPGARRHRGPGRQGPRRERTEPR